MQTFAVKTTRQVQMADITASVNDIVLKSNVKSGMCTVFVPHTTAGVTINENADPDVCRDIIKALDKIVPQHDGYAHSEGNSAAHIKASFMGFSQNIIIDAGKLQLGTWQGIYFCEFDGPRSRKVFIKIIKG